MNPYGSVEVPDHVPDEWQQRYGGAHRRADVEGSGEVEFRVPAVVIRLLIWVGAVTVIGAFVMWPATYLPRLLAALAFMLVGAAALLALARWVLDASDGPTRRRAGPGAAGGG